MKWNRVLPLGGKKQRLRHRRARHVLAAKMSGNKASTRLIRVPLHASRRDESNEPGVDHICSNRCRLVSAQSFRAQETTSCLKARG
jgi:hypothetical protein